MRISSALMLAGTLLATTAATAAPVRGAATGLSYNYLDGRVLLIDPDDGDDATGIRLGGSMLIQPQVFVSGGLTMLDFDEVEVMQLDPTVGYRHPVNSRMDLIGAGSLIWSDCDDPCTKDGDDSDIGFGLTGGIRSAITSQFEAGGFVSYENALDDSTIELTGEGLYAVTRQLQLLGALTISGDYNALQFGARWNF